MSEQENRRADGIRLVREMNGQRIERIERLYLDAFPKNERKPFSSMLVKCREGSMEMMAIEDGAGRFLGLVITILHRDKLLLAYFAISPEWRGKGVGSAALALILEHCGDRRLIIEIEDPEAPCGNAAERERRKRFYLSNGMKQMPFRVFLFGEEMLILTNGREVRYEEYHDIFDEVFSPAIGKKVRLL